MSEKLTDGYDEVMSLVHRMAVEKKDIETAPAEFEKRGSTSRMLNQVLCFFRGHLWVYFPETKDDVFTYWDSRCQRCGKYKSLSFKHYTSGVEK